MGRGGAESATAGGQSALRNQVGVFLLVVDLLQRGPQHQRDVAVLHPLFPHLEGRGFQDMTVHHRNWAHKAAGGRQVKEVNGTPGWVLFPGNGLEDQRSTVIGHRQCAKFPSIFGGLGGWGDGQIHICIYVYI